ncbi:MAG: hypothetical protein HY716_15705 [Planctomycetes bacterium]|nr:hypothetical protein [Planctomycetota bacterium]
MRGISGFLLRGLILLAGWLLVLYPNIPRALRQVWNLWHLNLLIEPDHPNVARLTQEFKDLTSAQPVPPRRQVALLEAFVQERIPFAHDWTTWGNVDYWPTASEAIDAGREDCDGRAVVAASILRRLGFDAHIEGNNRHIWVAVEFPDEPPEKILGAQPHVIFRSDRGWIGGLHAATVLTGMRYSLDHFPLWQWMLVVVSSVIALAPRRNRWIVLRLSAALACLGLAVLSTRVRSDILFGLMLAALAAAALGATLWPIRRVKPPVHFAC